MLREKKDLNYEEIFDIFEEMENKNSINLLVIKERGNF